MTHAIDLLDENLRTRYSQLVALPTHIFKKDRQMQLAPAAHFEHHVVVRRIDTQRHVRLELSLEPVAQLTTGDIFTFASCQRRRVDHEVHGKRGLVNTQHGQGFGGIRIHDCATDTDIFDTIDQHDVTRFCLIDQLSVKAAELLHLIDASLEAFALGTKLYQHILPWADLSAIDAPDADLSNVSAVVDRNDLQLQGAVGIVFSLRHVLENGVEKRTHVAASHIVGQACEARKARCIDNRKIQLLFGGSQLVKQIKGGVDDMVRAGTLPVNLVDHNDRFQTKAKCLACDESGLRHGAFNSVNQQEYAVNHGQHPFDFASEVRVSRGVNDVDVCTLVLDRTVFRQDGDATLFLDIARVHDPFGHVLVIAKGS